MIPTLLRIAAIAAVAYAVLEGLQDPQPACGTEPCGEAQDVAP